MLTNTMITMPILAKGFGDANASIRVYMAKPPPMAEYGNLALVQPLHSGEIALINQVCGNGWRKVFNVYAKLLFALDPTQFSFSQQASSWQQYRDTFLLQGASSTALLFGLPVFSVPETQTSTKTVHIIAGRTHAKALLDAGLPAQLIWLNHEFAIDKHRRLLVCPYFDYRQLNNEKLVYLAQLIKTLE